MADEMTNQSSSETTAEPEVMSFDGESTTTTSETEQTETSQKEQPKSEEEPSFLDIKYNGAEEHLTKDQAISLAQKGRNYDKLNQRYQEAINNPVMKVITEQAQRAGLTPEDYAERLSEFQKQSDISEIVQSYKAEHPDADDETVQAYAESAYENELNNRMAEEAQEEIDAQEAREQSARDQLNAFMQEYPDVDVTNLPDSVKHDIDVNGMTLLDAYRVYDLKLTKAALAAERKNSDNRQKSVGNVTNNSGGNPGGNDPFVDGLLG